MFKDYVENRRGLGIKPGLERIKACLDFLSNPQKKFKSVLITGTNGKGSVTYYLSNLIYKFTNHKAGRYTSPHLISWGERFVINEKEIESNYLEKFSYKVIKKIEDFEGKNNKTKMLTTFEVYATIAFSLFARENVDIAFLEAGMGGRLDATNIVDTQNVLCSIITSVSLDHMSYLGGTIEKIAYEKAGIIKENNFVVSGAKEPALTAIKNQAKKLNAKLTALNDLDNLLYLDKNKEIALCAWEIISKQIGCTFNKKDCKQFLESLQFPGRFQYIKDEKILLDGAHNPEAGIELRRALNNYFPNKKITYIIGILDKDYKTFIRNLIPQGANVICTEPKSKRATKKELLAICVQKTKAIPLLADNLQDAIEKAKKTENDLIVITGSLYLVGEVLDIINKRKTCLPQPT